MNAYENLEKAMAEVVDNLSVRIAALEAAPVPQTASMRFYAVSKADDGDLGTGLSDDADVLARLAKTAR